ncbi:hypothetical protein EV359DRAFT_83931 [Lentinula novae-zelandiae]|nr:hypothetical protein EV359DRAFT_83931 [Lentinula novae-zelandiae]
MDTCGKGDGDRSMEEDYLEWKDGIWEAFATAMGVEEGQGGNTADFAVCELESHPEEKVYLGELSARALTKIKGVHKAKNPYPTVACEFFPTVFMSNSILRVLESPTSMETMTRPSPLTYWNPRESSLPPTTYAAVLRHYIDISTLAGHQMLGMFATFASNLKTEAAIKEFNTNKEVDHEIVADGCLKAGKVLQLQVPPKEDRYGCDNPADTSIEVFS